MTTGWAGRRVLVTGATGMVGSWLSRRLTDRGCRVVAFVRDVDPQSEFYRSGTSASTTIVNGALEDYAAVERAINEHEIETVFHLGAQTIVGTALRAPLGTFEANIRGSYNVLEACRRLNDLVTAVVVASSDKAYGDSEELPYTEDMPPLGRHPYDVSKSCADLLATAYAHTYAMPVAIARCGNVYGGGDLNWSRIVPGTIRSAMRDERPVLRSDGTYVRDYLYVEDVVDGYLSMAEALLSGRAVGEAYNFSSESQVTARDMMQAVLRTCEAEHLEPIVADTAKAEIRHQSMNAGKARRQLGWTARHTLDSGLDRTVRWYREFFEHVD